ncbi:MAG: M60 family metallopeptidase [Prevotella sp.]|nr:M60 family metallopeptidase [Prevotella sp.]
MIKKITFFACALLFAVAAQAQWDFSADKLYKLKHVNSDCYLLLHDSYEETNVVNATTIDDEGSMFTITQSGDGYVFTKYKSDKTLGLSTSTEGNWANWNTSNTGSTAWKLVDAGGDYVYITSEKGYLGPNSGALNSGAYVYTNKKLEDNPKWQIIDVTDDLPNYVSSITSGKYYRLVSNTNQRVSMADDDGGVVTTRTDKTNYSQVWQLTSDDDGRYTFKNLLTGKYIMGWPGKSAQWKTGTSAAAFYSGKLTSGGNTVFWFATVNNMTEHKSLHSAPHQNNTVVGWQAAEDPSKWLLDSLDESTIDFAAIEELQQILNTNYTQLLTAFYDDDACTQLKSQYASMSDDELRSAMSELPVTLREEAVCVKNDKWNDNETWNRYEKDFRIHDYEVYSDRDAWANKLGIGEFSRLTQPTGIRLKSGELVFLHVSASAASGSQLYAELVSGVNIWGTRTTLKRGFNAIIASSDCEVFITYNCTNTNKLLSSFPNIKIHIVGGTCNGTFDMNRGHTESDWKWLLKNMFKDKYLHLRSKWHVMNCYLDRVKNSDNMEGALKIWDFVFETQEKLMTSRFNDGYYRPIMQVFDNSGGNPNWGGGRVSMPGIWGNGALNYNNLLYTGGAGGQQWVIQHEEGHGHQGPINLSGTTEMSNNGLAQIVTHLWGYRTTRGRAQNSTYDYFNEGVAWIDYPRRGDCLWLTNKLWYQLWLYFHLKGDDGFFARWIEMLRSMDGGIKKAGDVKEGENRADAIQRRDASRTISELQGKASTWGSWTSEYMRMALAACEASQTDLYEFFKMWGFFGYSDDVKTDGGDTDAPQSGIFRIGDYSNYLVRLPMRGDETDENAIKWCKDKMQSYSKKAPGVMFINDTGELTKIDADAECLKYDPKLATKKKQYADDGARQNQGGLGTYTHFGKNELTTLTFEVSGTKIVVTGKGAVGFKIYDDTGELIWVSNKMSFTTNKTIAEGITNGTYSLVASLGDDTDLLLSGPETDYAKKDPNGIEAIGLDERLKMKDDGSVFDLQGRKIVNGTSVNGKLPKGVYIVTGRKVVVQ